jgi:hypothetical protein
MTSIKHEAGTFGLDHGVRGNNGDICMDVMKADDGTVTHVPCENAFHRACFEEWANTNFSNLTSPTCPTCRANVAMRSVEASLGDPPTVLPLPLPPLGERSLTTMQSQMYDFDMGDAARHGSGFQLLPVSIISTRTGVDGLSG